MLVLVCHIGDSSAAPETNFAPRVDSISLPSLSSLSLVSYQLSISPTFQDNTQTYIFLKGALRVQDVSLISQWGVRPRANFRSWMPSDLPSGVWARRGGLGGQCGPFLVVAPWPLPALWGTFGGLGFVAPE